MGNGRVRFIHGMFGLGFQTRGSVWATNSPGRDIQRISELRSSIRNERTHLLISASLIYAAKKLLTVWILEACVDRSKNSTMSKFGP